MLHVQFNMVTRPKFLLLFVIAFTALGSFLAGRFITESKVIILKEKANVPQPQPSHVATQCMDPYKVPGYLYTPEDYRQSSYVPFDKLYHDYNQPDYAAYPWTGTASPDLSDPIPENEFLATSPHSWMLDLVTYNRYFDDSAYGGRPFNKARRNELAKSLAWLRGRRILMIADSVDRYMMAYLCEELGYEAVINKPRHTTASCTIPHLNFTIIHWHLASYYTSRPNWWWQDIMEYVPFEERYDKIFKDKLGETIGLNGKSPDLIIFQSGLWDQVTFNKKYASEPEGKYAINNKKNIMMERQSTWAELRFYGSRLQAFISHLRNLFGENAHIIHRALTPHKTFNDRDIMVLELDRVARSISFFEGVEVMDWAKLTAGFSSEWKDDVHVNKGALSWLYQNIMLSYLFRAAGGVEYQGEIIRDPIVNASDVPEDAWGECHDSLVLQSFENR
ncbi:hypothetical protein V1512DRAFT_266021 [Lipomyces arxii]|uniref:uncharacterized protein n=1 Tax=Lipomyces arxii TaxID=56418 RepID=UPI0034D004CA